jgi:hypothetical protein
MQFEKIKMALSGVKDILKEQDKKKQKSSLLEEFETIDQKYGGSGLQEIEYDPPSDEKLEEIAKAALEGKYAKAMQGIEDKFSKQYDALKEKSESLSQSYGDKLKDIEGYYGERKKEAEKDAIKKGIARSTIAAGQLEQYEREESERKLEAEKGIEEQIGQLNEQINSLESEKEKALAEQDILYAAELANKIYKLKEDRDKKLMDVIKYNNSVREKEKKSSEKDFLSAAEEKLAAAKKYFDGMSKAKALEELLSSDEYKKHLGAYYGYLLNYLSNKKGA